jgi:hypothetical protein
LIGALTEMLVAKIIIAPRPHNIVDGRRHYTICAIPYQDREMESARLKAVHEARVKTVPRARATSASQSDHSICPLALGLNPITLRQTGDRSQPRRDTPNAFTQRVVASGQC